MPNKTFYIVGPDYKFDDRLLLFSSMEKALEVLNNNEYTEMYRINPDFNNCIDIISGSGEWELYLRCYEIEVDSGKSI